MRKLSTPTIIMSSGLIIAFGTSIFTLIQYILLRSEMKQFMDGLSDVTASTVSFGMSMDAVSVSLGIITAGISVFALFGGILSIINIKQSKELDAAIDNAQKALENQNELLGARLIQEGRVYALRNRYKYAENNFNKVIETLPGTVSALICEYEIFSLYADIGTPEDIGTLEYRENLDHRFESLIKKIEYSKVAADEGKMIKADTYFTYGCICGNCALTEEGQKRKILLSKSVEAFSNAIELDNGNVDFYRNQAISYALADDIDKCKSALNKGRVLAESDILYSHLVDRERLKKLFKPSSIYLSDQMKEMLKREFDVQL